MRDDGAENGMLIKRKEKVREIKKYNNWEVAHLPYKISKQNS